MSRMERDWGGAGSNKGSMRSGRIAELRDIYILIAKFNYRSY